MTRQDRGRIRAMTGAALAAVWLAGMTLPVVAGTSGGNIGFLKDAPLTRFTGPDLKLFQQNLRAALEQNADGEVHRWQNPDTGSAGDIELVRSFAREGKRCRAVRISNRARGYAEAKTDAVFCRQASGEWKTQSPSGPAAAPK